VALDGVRVPDADVVTADEAAVGWLAGAADAAAASSVAKAFTGEGVAAARSINWAPTTMVGQARI
jgi:hypothetical protein